MGLRLALRLRRALSRAVEPSSRRAVEPEWGVGSGEWGIFSPTPHNLLIKVLYWALGRIVNT